MGDRGAVADGTKTSALAGSCRSDTAGGTVKGNPKQEPVKYVAESFVGTIIDDCSANLTPRVSMPVSFK